MNIFFPFSIQFWVSAVNIKISHHLLCLLVLLFSVFISSWRSFHFFTSRMLFCAQELTVFHLRNGQSIPNQVQWIEKFIIFIVLSLYKETWQASGLDDNGSNKMSFSKFVSLSTSWQDGNQLKKSLWCLITSRRMKKRALCTQKKMWKARRAYFCMEEKKQCDITSKKYPKMMEKRKENSILFYTVRIVYV